MRTSPETRLFGAFWADGTLDLVAGAAVILIGAGYLLDGLPLGGFPVEAIVVPMALVTWMALRKWVVEPRMGYVEFSRRRRERSTRELTGTAGLGIGLLLLVAAVAFGLRGGTAGLADSVAALPGPARRAGRPGHGSPDARAEVPGLRRRARRGRRRDPRHPRRSRASPVAGGFVVWCTGAVLLGRFLVESRRFEEVG